MHPFHQELSGLNNPLQAYINRSVAAKPDKAGSAEAAGGTPANLINDFGRMLKSQMDELNALQSHADEAVQTYAVGGPIELHNVMLAIEKSEMSLQFALQVRNKLVQAYQEVSRMQI